MHNVNTTADVDDGATVWLHIYDMSPKNKYTYPFGLGVYHSGVEVYGREYAYGGHDSDQSGIFNIPPKHPIPGLVHRETIKLGRTTLSRPQVQDLVKRMARDWTGRAYNIVHRNCNHFSGELAIALCGMRIPSWVNRLAYFGSLLPCTVDTEPDWVTPPNLSAEEENTRNRREPQ